MDCPRAGAWTAGKIWPGTQARATSFRWLSPSPKKQTRVKGSLKPRLIYTHHKIFNNTSVGFHTEPCSTQHSSKRNLDITRFRNNFRVIGYHLHNIYFSIFDKDHFFDVMSAFFWEMYFQNSGTFVFGNCKCVVLGFIDFSHFFKTCVRTLVPLTFVVTRNRVCRLRGCTFTFTVVLRISLLQKHLFYWKAEYPKDGIEVFRNSGNLWFFCQKQIFYQKNRNFVFQLKMFFIHSEVVFWKRIANLNSS